MGLARWCGTAAASNVRAPTGAHERKLPNDHMTWPSTPPGCPVRNGLVVHFHRRGVLDRLKAVGDKRPIDLKVCQMNHAYESQQFYSSSTSSSVQTRGKREIELLMLPLHAMQAEKAASVESI